MHNIKRRTSIESYRLATQMEWRIDSKVQRNSLMSILISLVFTLLLKYCTWPLFDENPLSLLNKHYFKSTNVQYI